MDENLHTDFRPISQTLKQTDKRQQKHNLYMYEPVEVLTTY